MAAVDQVVGDGEFCEVVVTGPDAEWLAAFTRTWKPFRDAVDSALLRGAT